MALHRTEAGYLDYSYPEEYLLEEDEMGESNPQFRLIKYLTDLLEWYYRMENWFVAGNLELYHPAIRNSQGKVTPDVAVFKGIEIPEETRLSLSSWDICEQNPPPPLVFEVSSRSTWRSDIWSGDQRKPAIYGRIGVKEYFAYDPHIPPIWSGSQGRRLLGWRYGSDGVPATLKPDDQGRLWSEVLEGWLAESGPYIKLYNRDGVQQTTASEQLEAAERRIVELERQLKALKGE